MRKTKEEKEIANIQKIIEWKIIETGAQVNAETDACLTHFFAQFVHILATKVYEAAPSCEEAERVFNESIAQAKNAYLEQQNGK